MNNNVFRKLCKYLKTDLITIIFTILLSMVVSILMIYIPKLYGEGIDEIIGTNNVNFNTLSEIIKKACIIIVVIGFVQWIQLAINNNIAYRLTRRLRSDAFRVIQRLPLAYLDSHQSGKTISIIINDVENVADGLILGLTQAFSGVTTIIATIVFMITINWIIAILVVVITPLSLFVAKFIAKKTYNMFKNQSEIRGIQTGFIDEMISNLKVVKAYNHEDDNLVKFDEINDSLEKCSFKAVFFSSLTNPSTRFVNSLVYALVACAGALFAIRPVSASLVVTAGTLTSLLSYANQYTKPFNEISSVITELQNAFACASRIFELINEPQEEIIPNEIIREDNLLGDIELKNVFFSYVEHQKLIENFNLQVKPGEKIAIVGPTGCGKTTLINLLMRFYDVTNGAILVDNYNIKEYNRKYLRSNYGMVLQDTWIKNATVKENITLGNQNITDEEIIEACKKAHCHNFIKKFKNGYDTIISEDFGLSGGQKQLICIARIMVLLPPILILDEATSSIDTRTEIKIQEAFDTLMKNKTSFIVAHRLSTIKEANRIIVMNNGHIIEVGNHQELLTRRGFYYNLYNSQFPKE